MLSCGGSIFTPRAYQSRAAQAPSDLQAATVLSRLHSPSPPAGQRHVGRSIDARSMKNPRMHAPRNTNLRLVVARVQEVRAPGIVSPAMNGDPGTPLAARMRPRTLDEFVGQEAVIG